MRNSRPRWRRPWSGKPPVLLAAFLLSLGVLWLGFDAYQGWHSDSERRQAVAQLLLSNQFRSSVANVHIWLEEFLAVHTEESLLLYQGEMRRAKQRLYRLREMLPPPRDEETKALRHVLELLSKDMQALSDLAYRRLHTPSSSGIGTQADARFDRVYRHLVRNCDRLNESISQYIDRLSSQHESAQQRIWVLLVWIILGVTALCWLLWRRYRNARARGLMHLRALQASERRFRGFFEHSPIALKEEDFSGVQKLLAELDPEKRRNLRDYLQCHPDFLCRCAKAIRVTHANREAVRLYGYDDAQQLIDDNAEHLCRREQHPLLIEKILMIERNSPNVSVEVRLYNHRHQWVHALMRVRILTGPEDWSRVVVSLIDINEQIQAQQQLDAANLHLRQAQEIARIGSWEMEFSAGYLHWSDMVYRIFGLPRNLQPSYQIFLDAVHPEDRAYVEAAWREHLEQGKEYRIVHRIVRSDGSLLYVEERCETRRNERGEPLQSLGTVQDVTRLIEAERQSRLLQDVFHAVADMIGVIDERYRLVYANRALRNVLGLGEDAPLSSVQVEQCFPERELRRLREEILPRLSQDGSWQGESTIYHCQQGEIEVSQRLQAHSDSSGRLTHISMIARDIRKEKQQQSKLEHMQRLESLGVLAGGIAHDFNNLLTVIMGYAAMAQGQCGDHPQLREHLDGIVRSSQSAADLCRQMLAYSGKGKFVIEHVDLSALVRDMGRLLSVSIHKQIVLHYDLGEALPAVAVDVAQIQQVVMNLVINAGEAIGERAGSITLSTGVQQADAEYLRSAYLTDVLPAGDYVYLEVTDTGCGMSEEVKARLFEPFFTTKFTGRGLGMSAILGIVRGHQGTIKVYSEAGKGSSFKVLLPASEEASRPLSSSHSVERSVEQDFHGHLLIVDDEARIREVAGMAARQMGLDVLYARDGIEAIECYRQRREDIVCVLLDMTMPRMGGKEAFSELRRIDSDVVVILSSGYNEQTATQQFVGKSLAGFIQKPYTPEALQQCIRRILKDRSAKAG